MRLDVYLVENGFAQSRNKAHTLIKEGLVHVDKKVVKKPSFGVEAQHTVSVEEHKAYVSRAAYKLLYFLEDILLDVSQKKALDIGSSTGGFTQVLLEAGAQSVSAVDVGTQQLHVSLRNDARVRLFENTDIRNFESDELFDVVVSDVAFISLLHILDDVHRLAKRDIILLFKPQFEVGREAKRDKHGVVLDKAAIAKAMERFEDACSLLGWKLVKKLPARLSGKEGNTEWCYYYTKGASDDTQ